MKSLLFSKWWTLLHYNSLYVTWTEVLSIFFKNALLTLPLRVSITVTNHTEQQIKGIKVSTMYPSSQTCSCCGNKNLLVTNLAVCVGECQDCHTVHNQDINVAINILKKGMQMQFKSDTRTQMLLTPIS